MPYESASFRRAQRAYEMQTPWDNDPPEDYDAEKARDDYEAAMEAKYDRQRAMQGWKCDLDCNGISVL